MKKLNQALLITSCLLTGVICITMLKRPFVLKPVVQVNTGSSLVGVNNGLEAILQFKAQNSNYPFYGQTLDELKEFGLMPEIMHLITLLNLPSNSNMIIVSNTIVLVGNRVILMEDGTSGKYVGLANGATMLVPITNAVLGSPLEGGKLVLNLTP